MRAKKWFLTIVCILLAFLVLIGGLVVYLDPFFHYHAPLAGYDYVLEDQRYQNDGITRHFTYDAVITGTSMAENFRTTQFDAAFGSTSVKLPYPGATYKEVNDNLKKAFRNHEVRYVLRPLDLTHLVEDKDAMRTDMGEYPDYLYDNNPLNDVNYLYNSNVLFGYIIPMLVKKAEGRPGSITSFDDYSWSGSDTYSAANALEGHTSFTPAAEQPALTPEEEQTLRENIEANVTSTAKEHPDTTFIYFFPPYSAAWYGLCLENGTFEKQLEAERIAAEMMLACGNIHAFLFSSDTDITMNLDHYKDMGHYSPEVSTTILADMAAAVTGAAPSPYEITTSSLDTLLAREKDLYEDFDYSTLVP